MTDYMVDLNALDKDGEVECPYCMKIVSFSYGASGRNTAFSKLKIDRMKEFQELFNSAELKPFFGNENVTSVIEGPAMMVIPIAIYI